MGRIVTISEGKVSKSGEKKAVEATAPKVDRRHDVGVDHWIKSGMWVNVRSSNVKRISYDHPGKTFWVEFRGGAVYKCENFPLRLAKGYFGASSMGRFHWSLRRAGWKFTLVS